MNVITEITPNPETLKFKVSKNLVETNGIEFKSVEDAKGNKFVEDLFQIQGVEGIYVGVDFISVTKINKITWNQLKPKILSYLLDSLNSAEPIFKKNKIEENENNKQLDKVSKKIKDIIDLQVRPAVAKDGGDIIFKSYENGVVNLKLKGACSGCPSSTATLKNGIENLLKHYLPEIKSVNSID